MDKSLLEEQHESREDMSSLLVFGRVTKVYPDTRVCEVKTFGKSSVANDNHIDKCQWLTPDAHVSGGESTIIPKVGSYCIVAFIDGEPFILGFFKPLNEAAEALSGNEFETLNLGDKMISTSGGNRIILKANGLIDIQSKETLKRIYFPLTSEIRDLCRNSKFHADGGLIHWQNNGLGKTLWQGEFRKDTTKSSVFVKQSGEVSTTVIDREAVGVGTGAAPFSVPFPVYEKTVDIAGNVVLKVNPPGAPNFEMTIAPTGEVTMKNLAMSASVSPKGDISAENKTSSVDMTASGDLNYKNPTASLDIAKTGDLAFKNPTAKINIKKTGDLSFKNPAGSVDMTAKGDTDIKSGLAFLKLTKDGKVAVGGEIAEVVDSFIKTLEQLSKGYQQKALESHVGNLGYNVSPPTNSAQYTAIQTQLETLKSLVEQIKG